MQISALCSLILEIMQESVEQATREKFPKWVVVHLCRKGKDRLHIARECTSLYCSLLSHLKQKPPHPLLLVFWKLCQLEFRTPHLHFFLSLFNSLLSHAGHSSLEGELAYPLLHQAFLQFIPPSPNYYINYDQVLHQLIRERLSPSNK